MKNHPAKDVICSGIVWQMEAAAQPIAAKVTGRCPACCHEENLSCYCLLTSKPGFFLVSKLHEKSLQIYFLLSHPIKELIIVLLVSHFHVGNAVVPFLTWRHATSLVLVQSTRTNTVIGLNKDPKIDSACSLRTPSCSFKTFSCSSSFIPESTVQMQHRIPFIESTSPANVHKKVLLTG